MTDKSKTTETKTPSDRELARKAKALERKEKELETKEIALTEIKKVRMLLRHIQNVQEACHLLGEKMMEQGEVDFGRILIANSMLHDNSKFYGVEWEHLNPDAASDKSDIFAASLTQHQVTNEHHPEYWGGVNDMPRIYIAEMVCDWFARSVEMGTDLRAFFLEVALEKYDIKKNGKKYREIKEFIDLILEQPFKPVKKKA